MCGRSCAKASCHTQRAPLRRDFAQRLHRRPVLHLCAKGRPPTTQTGQTSAGPDTCSAKPTRYGRRAGSASVHAQGSASALSRQHPPPASDRSRAEAARTGMANRQQGRRKQPGTRAAPPKLAAHSAADAACIPAHSPETSRIPPPRRRARPCAARFSDRSCLRPNQPSPVPLFLRGLTALRPVPQVLPAKTAAQCAAPDIKRGAPLPEQDFLRLPHSAQQRTARAAESAAAPKARIAASG